MTKRTHDYTPDEDRLIRTHYPEATISHLLEVLPHRNAISIRDRAHDLGVKRERRGGGVPIKADLLATLTEAEKGYIAGLIDGEGCISFARRKSVSDFDYTIAVSVSNTDRRMIEWLMCKIPYGAVFCEERPGQRRQLTLYRWQLGVHASMAFLRSIAPYLVIKREQAEALQNGYRHLSPADRLALHARMRELKTKGSTDLYGVPVKQRCSPS